MLMIRLVIGMMKAVAVKNSFFKMKRISLYMIVLCLFSCVHTDENCTTDPVFIDDGEPNENVLDNTIYRGGLSFYYDLWLRSYNEKDPLFILYDDLLNHTYVKEIDPEQKTPNTVKLSIYNNTAGSNIADEQTIIKYEYLDNDCFFKYLSERTGLIENDKMVFLHPPRAHGFEVFEMAPFPYLEKPFALGDQWESNMHVPAKSREDYGISFSDIHHKYHLNGIQTITIEELGDLKCYEICVKSFDPDNNIIVTGTYYFNEQYGFVKTDVDFLEDFSISLTLKKIE